MSVPEQSKFSLEGRLDFELLSKAVESSLGMVLVVAVLLFIQFKILNFPSYLKVLSTLIAVFSVARFLYLKAGLTDDALRESRIRFLKFTIIPMQMFTGMDIGMSLFQVQFQGVMTVALLIVVTVVTATSMMTLASHRWICTGVQTVLVSWVILPSLVVWSHANSNEYGIYCFGFMIYYVFLFRQSAYSFKEIKKKYHYEMILERINVELRESRARVIEETAKAEHASRLAYLGEMAGGMAHEINNPTGIILMLASKLEHLVQGGSVAPEVILEIAKKVEVNATRISKIIQGLKSFSSNADHSPLEWVSVEKLWNQVRDLTSGRFAQAEISFEVMHQIPDQLVECRSVQIIQACVNLVNNAIDAVTGTENSWVKVETQLQEGLIEFRIQDSGHGIPPTIASKIFNPLFSTKGMHKATGLGLSVGLGLLKQHHGTIFLEENTIHTTFVIQLPMSQTSELQ